MKTTEQVNDTIKRAITRGAKPSPTPASRVKTRRALLDAQVAALRSAIETIRARARETPAWSHGYNSAVTAIELQIADLTQGTTREQAVDPSKRFGAKGIHAAMRCQEHIAFDAAMAALRRFGEASDSRLWPTLSGNEVQAFANAAIDEYLRSKA